MSQRFITFFSLALCILPIACSPSPPPDDTQFIELVAALSVEGAPALRRSTDESEQQIVVIDEASLPAEYPDVSAVIIRMLDERGLPYVVESLDPDNPLLPGELNELEQIGPLSWVYKTHSLLEIIIEDDGSKRLVRWQYVCGPICGYGKQVEFTWTGKEWITKQIGTFVF